MSKTITPPLKWHGGKQYLAERIIGLMPPRCKNPNAPASNDPGWLHFVEPYFGGGAVMLALDPEGISEVVNDIDGQLTNFWECLQRAETYAGFKRVVECVPFNKKQWSEACAHLDRKCRVKDARLDNPVCEACALAFFVACRQSLAGRMKHFAPLTRNRTRRGMNEQVSAWLNCVEGLPEVHERLKRVVILNDDALTVIRQQDGPRTLFYLDPPYLHETRATTGEYAHEMTVAQHDDLLRALASIKGRFLLSGYRSDLYDRAAKVCQWRRHEFEIPNNAASGKKKRVMTECVWTNF
jgi:DNA adenine methylase